MSAAAPLDIGAWSEGAAQYFNGWIDEVRISKGIARWTSDFTLPTAAYTNSLVSDIAENILYTFVIPNTRITRGRIDASTFTVDSLKFLSTVDEALKTLSDLDGEVEYGVDEDLVFFWRTESLTITHKFFVGNNVSMLERRVNWDEMVNKIYLVGGDVAGTKYKRTAQNTDSQTNYYLAEQILSNSAIVSDTVADQYMGAILSEKAQPALNIRAKIENTDVRIEDAIPMGLVSFYDATYDRDSLGDWVGDIVGEAADGGSDIVIGLTADGGDDIIIGGQFSAQIDRISYELSDTADRFNIEIQLGDTVLETAARIKKLELAMSSVNQY
jgi:hypothetical protein